MASGCDGGSDETICCEIDGAYSFLLESDCEKQGGSPAPEERCELQDVCCLNADGTVRDHQKISDTEGDFQGTIREGDNFGRSVAAIGDIDTAFDCIKKSFDLDESLIEVARRDPDLAILKDSI